MTLIEMRWDEVLHGQLAPLIRKLTASRTPGSELLESDLHCGYVVNIVFTTFRRAVNLQHGYLGGRVCLWPPWPKIFRPQSNKARRFSASWVELPNPRSHLEEGTQQSEVPGPSLLSSCFPSPSLAHWGPNRLLPLLLNSYWPTIYIKPWWGN